MTKLTRTNISRLQYGLWAIICFNLGRWGCGWFGGLVGLGVYLAVCEVIKGDGL